MASVCHSLRRMPRMRAIQYEQYGAPPDVLRLEEVDVPEPGEGEVLLRVHAASANPVEWHLVRGEPFLVRLISGIRRPKDAKVGGDVAGVVEAVGAGVTRLAPGDAVFGTADGSFAELACAKVERLARKPQAMTFEQAASIPVAGCTALQALRDHGRLRPAQHVLVIGAAGGVGSFAVQIAKALGAHVTGVCSTAHLDFVRALGADTLVDYTREEPSGRYDVVVRVAGDASVAELRRLLTAQGSLVIVGGGTGRDGKAGVLGPLTRMLVAHAVSRKSGRRVAAFIAKIRTPDLEALAALVEKGQLRPAVERTYPLEQAAAALTEIESGHTTGKLVVTIG
jgi:NADPH:quinone reductase-like Zn-dependent oxidoreductase